MSNQQWPPPQGNGPGPSPQRKSPWAQPDARWTPQSYHDAAGRDPRQPFGVAAEPESTPGIDQFEAPRGSGRKTVWLGFGIVAAIVGLLLMLQFTGGFSSTDPGESPTPSNQAEPGKDPEPVATGGTSIPFEGNGTGVFEILSQSWSEEGLKIEYRITLDEGQGERRFSLYMFTNSTLELADPIDYEVSTVVDGQPFTGSAEFRVDQADSTLVLASSLGTAITALPLPA